MAKQSLDCARSQFDNKVYARFCTVRKLLKLGKSLQTVDWGSELFLQLNHKKKWHCTLKTNIHEIERIKMVFRLSAKLEQFTYIKYTMLQNC